MLWNKSLPYSRLSSRRNLHDELIRNVLTIIPIIFVLLLLVSLSFVGPSTAACGRRHWKKWNWPASVRPYRPSERSPEATPAWKRCTWTPTTARCAWPCRAIGPGRPYSLTTTLDWTVSAVETLKLRLNCSELRSSGRPKRSVRFQTALRHTRFVRFLLRANCSCGDAG